MRGLSPRSRLACWGATVEFKTCSDRNGGVCPRLDSGKLCVFGDSKKQHICSKVIGLRNIK